MESRSAPDDLAALAALDDPLRRRLYEYVVSRGDPVGRDEAANAVGIGRSLAAYHLDLLAAHGLLAVSRRRTSGRSGPGAGRPAKLYARAAREIAASVPARDYALAARLLADAADDDESGTVRASVTAAARRLGRRLGEAAGRRGSALRRLERVLRERGYEPFDDDGVVRMRNCPFHEVAAGHPDTVCGMNLALLEGIADGLGADGLDLALEPEPGRCCVAVRRR